MEGIRKKRKGKRRIIFPPKFLPILNDAERKELDLENKTEIYLFLLLST